MSLALAERPNLSGEIAAELRQWIVEGRLPAGERLNEVRLAALLGVSRTPIREALGRLESEGAITSLPRIGFSVRPLTAEEFRQIYPIRSILDPEALKLAGIPSPKRVAALQRMNEGLARSGDPESVISRSRPRLLACRRRAKSITSPRMARDA